MDTKCPRLQLHEFAEVQTGPFGSQLHQRDYVLDGTPIVTVEHLGDNRLLHEDLPRVSPTDCARLSKYALRPGDIVFSRVGSVDRRALVRENEAGWLFSGRCLRVRPAPHKADGAYLSYYFGLPAFKEHIRAIAVGATMPSLNTALMEGLLIPLPALSEQRRIAGILGALDDKIELNRRMCATLEEMARAIFCSWFVDFDPVRAKVAAIAEGRDPERAAMAAISGKKEEDLDSLAPETLASLRATAALFPSSFTDSELGEIPEGWEIKPLPEAIEVNPRRTLGKGQLAPYVDMASLPTSSACVSSPVAREFGSGSKFINGDTLLARITPCLENGKGAFVDLLEEGEVGWGSTEFIVLCPKPPLPPEFGYLLSRHEDFRSFAISNMSGTSGRQRVPNECLSSYNIAVPSDPVAEAFARVVSPMFKLMRATTDQSRTLATLRDTLLPKLLSGELRVGEATQEEAVLA